MRYYLVLLIALLFCLSLSAQEVKQQEEKQLSKSFKKALEGAFSFDPAPAPLPKQEENLTVEQLHEWVGEPKEKMNLPDAVKFDSTYKALKMWEKDFCALLPLPPASIDMKISVEVPKTGITTDIGESLGYLLSAKQRRMKKMHALTEKTLKKLDAAFPMTEKR